MIDWILARSVERRHFVLLLAILLAAIGVCSALRLSIDAVPDITGVQVQVNSEVPALAPEEVEKLVTVPLEQELAGVPGVKEMRSLSKFGLSQVTLQFTDKTGIYHARQLVGERVQGALDKLPPKIIPRLAPVTTGLGEVFHYTLDYTPDARNKLATRREQLMELESIQEYTLKPLLRAVPGVADINTAGGYERQIVVQPKLERLRDAN
ncbi:MAG TPA: efflux RND transporter permease subunit, partial [Verrucomicrobiae bacterium]|nr:efflux RND transporter permease subunit [Verrucomicrobiae bacterium]